MELKKGVPYVKGAVSAQHNGSEEWDCKTRETINVRDRENHCGH